MLRGFGPHRFQDALKTEQLGEQPAVPAGLDSPRDPGIGSVTAQV